MCLCWRSTAKTSGDWQKLRAESCYAARKRMSVRVAWLPFEIANSQAGHQRPSTREISGAGMACVRKAMQSGRSGSHEVHTVSTPPWRSYLKSDQPVGCQGASVGVAIR